MKVLRHFYYSLFHCQVSLMTDQPRVQAISMKTNATDLRQIKFILSNGYKRQL